MLILLPIQDKTRTIACAVAQLILDKYNCTSTQLVVTSNTLSFCDLCRLVLFFLSLSLSLSGGCCCSSKASSAMSLLLTSPLPYTTGKLKQQVRLLSSSSGIGRLSIRKRSMGFNFNDNNSRGNGVKAFFYNPAQDPVLKEALKEPVAFLGGVFAGILRLDLNEEPLKEWITRTAEAAGIGKEEIDAEGSTTTEAAPQEIQIE
ncbi:hypothetical protein RIF29_21732 [Crotalaria pallida]|uniref:Uncharacterized protein n=1 Tax=Crotalaria pallida TaxID=3830 RepID=A0AAN9I7F8_CROPI